mmetsp:Transcript_9439/g.13937  ORF Transcript_9439/g.13937 Transcript_9439/m.13937 type:complete len:208 (+) Transcript_9439:33-656(+)
MNSLLLGTSKFAVSSLRSNRAAPATRLVAARCFSSGDDVSSGDDQVKTGIIKYFSYKTQFGFILPDGVDRKSHDDSDLIFIHRNDIKAQQNADGEKFYPGLKRNQRVAFKVSPPDKEGAKCAKAYDLTMADGELVPAFQKGYFERYIKTQKAQFGDRVFQIMSTCTDQQDMETQIVSAFDQVKENIEKQRAKMERAGMAPDEPAEEK